jgi:hypothetical protein
MNTVKKEIAKQPIEKDTYRQILILASICIYWINGEEQIPSINSRRISYFLIADSYFIFMS